MWGGALFHCFRNCSSCYCTNLFMYIDVGYTVRVIKCFPNKILTFAKNKISAVSCTKMVSLSLEEAGKKVLLCSTHCNIWGITSIPRSGQMKGRTFSFPGGEHCKKMKIDSNENCNEVAAENEWHFPTRCTFLIENPSFDCLQLDNRIQVIWVWLTTSTSQASIYLVLLLEERPP